MKIILYSPMNVGSNSVQADANVNRAMFIGAIGIIMYSLTRIGVFCAGQCKIPPIVI